MISWHFKSKTDDKLTADKTTKSDKKIHSSNNSTIVLLVWRRWRIFLPFDSSDLSDRRQPMSIGRQHSIKTIQCKSTFTLLKQLNQLNQCNQCNQLMIKQIKKWKIWHQNWRSTSRLFELFELFGLIALIASDAGREVEEKPEESDRTGRSGRNRQDKRVKG